VRNDHDDVTIIAPVASHHCLTHSSSALLLCHAILLQQYRIPVLTPMCRWERKGRSSRERTLMLQVKYWQAMEGHTSRDLMAERVLSRRLAEEIESIVTGAHSDTSMALPAKK
jgi:hypothetical protein